MFSSSLIPAKVSPAARLVVLVHGWSAGPKKLGEVAALVGETLPDAACLMVRHDGGGILSNARPTMIADQIAHTVQHAWDDAAAAGKPYRDIILMGHSAGALLVRKAYAYAAGFLEDSEAGRSYDWWRHVERIVSLAGIDRGIPFTGKTDNMSWLSFLWRRIAYNVARFTHCAKFIRSLQRGEAFVANLRITWIRMLQKRDDELTVAPSFQLVGDRDDLVSFGDNIDNLLKSKNFVYRPVIGANHATIVRPSRVPDVKREIVTALTCQPDRSNDYNNSEMTDVFYVIHGIRDIGTQWTRKLCEAINDEIAAVNAAGAADPKYVKRNARTVRPSYGYFGMLSFLLSWDRQRNVRWFVDIYTQMVARYPKANHHYIGHSNGTYLMASAVTRYETCKVLNIVFAGSVVPSAFDWTKYFETGQVSYVRNDVGNADWVVGIFPHLWELAADVLSRFDVGAPKWLDLGGAGFNGFYDDRASSNCYLPGDHGAALTPANFVSMAKSAVHGIDVAPDRFVATHQPLVEWLSKFAWLALPVAAGLIYGDVLAWHYNPILGAVVTAILLLLLYTV